MHDIDHKIDIQHCTRGACNGSAGEGMFVGYAWVVCRRWVVGFVSDCVLTCLQLPEECIRTSSTRCNRCCLFNAGSIEEIQCDSLDWGSCEICNLALDGTKWQKNDRHSFFGRCESYSNGNNFVFVSCCRDLNDVATRTYIRNIEDATCAWIVAFCRRT